MTSTIPAPSDKKLKAILESARTIAVVGWSDKEDRPSHGVANYLRKQGYHVIPVNPRLAGKEWDGQMIYECVTDVPESLDIVDLFRRSEFTPHHAEQAVRASAKTLWLQLGIVNDEAGHIALDGDLDFVQDRCTQIEHLRLIRGLG